MTAANRVRLLLTALRPGREDAQAAERVVAIKGRLDALAAADTETCVKCGCPWTKHTEYSDCVGCHACGAFGSLEDALDEHCHTESDEVAESLPARDYNGDIAFLLARVDLLEGRCRDARESLEVARSEIERLEDAVDTATARQWESADERDRLRGQLKSVTEALESTVDEQDRINEPGDWKRGVRHVRVRVLAALED